MDTKYSLYPLVLLFVLYGLARGAVDVRITPERAILPVGASLRVLCKSSQPLLYCRVTVPGVGGLNMYPKLAGHDGIRYFGNGFDKGECGAEFQAIQEIHNGNIVCSMGFATATVEGTATMRLTVAKAPPAPILNTTRGTHESESFLEGETVRATCKVVNARPVANISWYIDDERITYGLSHLEFEQGENDQMSVSQSLSHKVRYTDNGKNLKCVASHMAQDINSINSTLNKLTVRFPPKPPSREIERFGFTIGQPGDIVVQVYANPQPNFTWEVGSELLTEGAMDTTRRLLAQSNYKGHGMYDASLKLTRVSNAEVDRRYILWAQNALGKERYLVAISTNPAPPPEMTAGAIAGIVIAGLLIVLLVFMLIFARATGRWCFAGGAAPRHNAESTVSMKKKKRKKKTNSVTPESLTYIDYKLVVNEDGTKMYVSPEEAARIEAQKRVTAGEEEPKSPKEGIPHKTPEMPKKIEEEPLPVELKKSKKAAKKGFFERAFNSGRKTKEKPKEEESITCLDYKMVVAEDGRRMFVPAEEADRMEGERRTRQGRPLTFVPDDPKEEPSQITDETIQDEGEPSDLKRVDEVRVSHRSSGGESFKSAVQSGNTVYESAIDSSDEEIAPGKPPSADSTLARIPSTPKKLYVKGWIDEQSEFPPPLPFDDDTELPPPPEMTPPMTPPPPLPDSSPPSTPLLKIPPPIPENSPSSPAAKKPLSLPTTPPPPEISTPGPAEGILPPASSVAKIPPPLPISPPPVRRPPVPQSPTKTDPEFESKPLKKSEKKESIERPNFFERLFSSGRKQKRIVTVEEALKSDTEGDADAESSDSENEAIKSKPKLAKIFGSKEKIKKKKDRKIPTTKNAFSLGGKKQPEPELPKVLAKDIKETDEEPEFEYLETQSSKISVKDKKTQGKFNWFGLKNSASVAITPVDADSRRKNAFWSSDSELVRRKKKASSVAKQAVDEKNNRQKVKSTEIVESYMRISKDASSDEEDSVEKEPFRRTFSFPAIWRKSEKPKVASVSAVNSDSEIVPARETNPGYTDIFWRRSGKKKKKNLEQEQKTQSQPNLTVASDSDHQTAESEDDFTDSSEDFYKKTVDTEEPPKKGKSKTSWWLFGSIRTPKTVKVPEERSEVPDAVTENPEVSEPELETEEIPGSRGKQPEDGSRWSLFKKKQKSKAAKSVDEPDKEGMGGEEKKKNEEHSEEGMKKKDTKGGSEGRKSKWRDLFVAKAAVSSKDGEIAGDIRDKGDKKKEVATRRPIQQLIMYVCMFGSQQFSESSDDNVEYSTADISFSSDSDAKRPKRLFGSKSKQSGKRPRTLEKEVQPLLLPKGTFVAVDRDSMEVEKDDGKADVPEKSKKVVSIVEAPKAERKREAKEFNFISMLGLNKDGPAEGKYEVNGEKERKKSGKRGKREEEISEPSKKAKKSFGGIFGAKGSYQYGDGDETPQVIEVAEKVPKSGFFAIFGSKEIAQEPEKENIDPDEVPKRSSRSKVLGMFGSSEKLKTRDKTTVKEPLATFQRHSLPGSLTGERRGDVKTEDSENNARKSLQESKNHKHDQKRNSLKKTGLVRLFGQKKDKEEAESAEQMKTAVQDDETIEIEKAEEPKKTKKRSFSAIFGQKPKPAPERSSIFERSQSADSVSSENGLTGSYNFIPAEAKSSDVDVHKSWSSSATSVTSKSSDDEGNLPVVTPVGMWGPRKKTPTLSDMRRSTSGEYCYHGDAVERVEGDAVVLRSFRIFDDEGVERPKPKTRPKSYHDSDVGKTRAMRPLSVHVPNYFGSDTESADHGSTHDKSSVSKLTEPASKKNRFNFLDLMKKSKARMEDEEEAKPEPAKETNSAGVGTGGRDGVVYAELDIVRSGAEAAAAKQKIQDPDKTEYAEIIHPVQPLSKKEELRKSRENLADMDTVTTTPDGKKEAAV